MSAEQEPISAGQEKLLPKRRIVALLFLVFRSLPHVVLGLLVFWQFALTGVSLGNWAIFVLIAMVPVLYLLHVALHELGHVVMALAARLRVIRVQVGPLSLIRTGSKFRLRSSPPLAGTDGYVAALPLTEPGWGWRMGLLTSGGPLANLLVGLVCLGLAPSLNDPSAFMQTVPYRATRPANAFLRPMTVAAGSLNIAGVLGLWMVCTNLVPSRVGGIDNDGLQLLTLLTKPQVAKRNTLLAILCGNMMGGTRPRDWEPAMVQRLLAARDGSPEDASSNLYGYYHARDSGQLDEAGQLLDLALAQRDGYPIGSREALFLEGAYFEARYRRNLAAAQTWLEQCKPGPAEKQTWCRAEAAVLWLEGRHAEAAARAEAGLEAIPHSVDLGGRLAEKEWLEELLEVCQNSITDANAGGQPIGGERAHSSSQA